MRAFSKNFLKCNTHIYPIFIVLFILVSCKTKQSISSTSVNVTKQALPILVNDSVAKYEKYKTKIFKTLEGKSSFQNKITLHFKKYISKKSLKKVVFNEWRKNIYVEFNLDKHKRILNFKTNAAYVKIDHQIIKALKKLNFEDLNIHTFDPRYKYTLIIIQNINGKPNVKCTTSAIGFIPPIFDACKNENSYESLSRCNYMYITNFLYNHVDLSYVLDIDLDNNHKINPHFIINKKGEVVAAKVASQNKELLESFYKAIKQIPKALFPAKLDDQHDYYGYNFPTGIDNIIRNNNEFKKFYYQHRFESASLKELMKEFVAIEYQKRQKKIIYKVGF